VRAVVVSNDAFTSNKRGFPVLPKRHQEFVTNMLRRNVQVVIRAGGGDGDLVMNPKGDLGDDTAVHEPTPAEAAAAEDDNADPTRRRWEYLVYLFRKIPQTTEQELVEAGYRDYLQAPLQPLMDNLESATYETFEKDASKYLCYEEAVFNCLKDRVSDVDAAGGKTTVLMVVGAGRGPLVRASLRASERSGRPLRVYAVEKNPNAVITLQSLVEAEGWSDLVTVISSDMRSVDPPEPADVLVSELLGSFGDNELSPECLDGAQRFLKPGGVSIPQAYTSYLAPVTCAKLWNDAKAYGDLAHMETPYVVKLHRCASIADPAEVFTFEHPNEDKVIDNSRYAKLRWRRSQTNHAATMHGFAGYFDAKLYSGPAGDVHCSIYPPTHTMGPSGEPMFSWFPIYFPLRYPVYVPAGCDVEAHVWRCVGPSKVWYEWGTTSPDVGPVHNVNGRSYWVGL
jgi:protein arginine N-methyltransferase 5